MPTGTPNEENNVPSAPPEHPNTYTGPSEHDIEQLPPFGSVAPKAPTHPRLRAAMAQQAHKNNQAIFQGRGSTPSADAFNKFLSSIKPPSKPRQSSLYIELSDDDSDSSPSQSRSSNKRKADDDEHDEMPPAKQKTLPAVADEGAGQTGGGDNDLGESASPESSLSLAPQRGRPKDSVRFSTYVQNTSAWPYPFFEETPEAEKVYWVIMEGPLPGVYHGYTEAQDSNPNILPDCCCITEAEANAIFTQGVMYGRRKVNNF